MAYSLAVATILNQYLKTATGGNVIARRAVAVDRWYLFCERCDTRLTFAEDYDIAEEYEKKGRLDGQIQAFAKEHLHLKPNFNPLTKTVTYMPEQGPFAKAQSPPIPHKPLPQTASAFLVEQQMQAQKQKNEALIAAKIEVVKAEAKKKYELEQWPRTESK